MLDVLSEASPLYLHLSAGIPQHYVTQLHGMLGLEGLAESTPTHTHCNPYPKSHG